MQTRLVSVGGSDRGSSKRATAGLAKPKLAKQGEKCGEKFFHTKQTSQLGQKGDETDRETVMTGQREVARIKKIFQSSY